MVCRKLDTLNKAGTATEILRQALGVQSTIPNWAEDRLEELIDSFKGKKVDPALLRKIHAQLLSEGLVSRYPAVIEDLVQD